MISNKTFTEAEFESKVKEFAQEFVNRLTPENPGVQASLIKQGPRTMVLRTGLPGGGGETCVFTLAPDGLVETIMEY
ncbi:hypothetical protein fHeYen901_236 [Yersinia phage fHe-Yen9-01]|uniref:DUF7320 domain-containing protein n=1 Tax=Yersinia phage fHe-Yen9-01 TaxID=1965363 RepID=A0A1V0DXY2_9CAUD|nr:hypothetical protein KNT60_gp235 [Yersinia phage fHe-Yen9-01]ARB06009.1 hypothetical protein fHeYen901_236 [Yersinia phage fHe-Yen9-01]